MNEIEYEKMQEDVAIGTAIAGNMKAILEDHDCTTLSQLRRCAYKYTEAGVFVSFEKHDGTLFEEEEKVFSSPDGINWVRRIGVSSIIEGSDAEVPIAWIDLIDFLDEGGEEKIVIEYNNLLERIDKEACALWEEVYAGEDFEEEE